MTTQECSCEEWQKEQDVELLTGLISAFGLSASAGLNAYIPLLVVALLGRFTNVIHLTPPWDVLTNEWVIAVLVVLVLIEFFADKFPAINHFNDAIQTFVRPAAGAILFAASAGVISDIHPVFAAIVGLLVAGSVHAVKSLAVRPAVSLTTGGAGNIPVSILEDVVSTIVSLLSIIVPILLMLTAMVIVIWVFLRMRRRPRDMRTV
jgi:hypothetical protein